MSVNQPEASLPLFWLATSSERAHRRRSMGLALYSRTPSPFASLYPASSSICLAFSRSQPKVASGAGDQAYVGTSGVMMPVSYTHLRAHETDSYLVCRLLLEK